jgi:uncharacterized protein (TIGR00730 family)
MLIVYLDLSPAQAARRAPMNREAAGLPRRNILPGKAPSVDAAGRVGYPLASVRATGGTKVPAASDREDGAPSIAVFGSSEALPGEPLYEQARSVGRLLAEAGFVVVTGGYGGVMEGASRGAAEAGGTAVGVVCGIFRGRAPNPYLDEIVDTPDLFARTRTLIERARGYVVLEGKSGTLAEVALLWALHRAGSLDRRPVVLLADAWRALLRHLVLAGVIESEQFDVTRVVDSPEEAVAAVREFLDRGVEA